MLTVASGVFVEVFNKGTPALTECLPFGHSASTGSLLILVPSELMNEPDVVIAPLIRRRIKVELLSGIIVDDAIARVQCILTRRAVLPKRDWISLGVGIHGSRTGPVRDTTVLDEVESPPLRGLDNGPASASGLSLPLRERFELEASESSSRGRRDPTLGSTRVEDEVPSSSSYPSSMSAMSLCPQATSFAWESLASSQLK
ncbi:unnamed protein product [Phytophthora fragariaefolia]|uniref:Unnamed protein product n=1 Tax=Phytophthora fragariaefolia TaxID=1490495 RepID=A0A9W6YC63_9STRA|nr:unnamed protein product [Phytophthora fragariaefolia]